MRIAIMCSAPGGAGLVPYPVDLAIAFKKLGHEVDGICGSNREYETGLRASLDRAGVRMHVVPFSESTGLRGISPFNHSLRRKLDEIGPEIVHSWGPRFAYQGRALKRRGPRPLHVAMIMRMGHDASKWSSRLGARVANRYLDRVLACCSIELDRMREVGVREDKLGLMLAPISCGPILEAGAAARARGRQRILAEFGLPAERKLIGCFAQFRPVKRQDLLLKAFTKLSGEFPEWDLVLPGAGELEPICRELAKAIPGRVHFLGSIAHEKAIALTAVVDAVVHSSEAETFGWSMLESLILSRPAVLTRVGVGAEIQRAEMATVIDPGSVETLVEGMRRVMRGDAGVQEMAERGAAWVTRTFDSPVVAGNLIELYGRMLSEASCAQ